MRNRIVLAVALALTALVTSKPASAYTAQQQAACQGDAQAFCSQYIPDQSGIRRCLAANINRISAACRAQFRGARRRHR